MSKETVVDYNTPDPDFDWAAHEADCPSARRSNTKANNGIKLYCTEPYAKEAAKLYDQDFSERSRVIDVRLNKSYEGTVSSIDVEWCRINIGARDDVYIDMENLNNIMSNNYINKNDDENLYVNNIIVKKNNDIKIKSLIYVPTENWIMQLGERLIN